MKEIPFRKDFIHHQEPRLLTSVREIVFGAEDGMVSTVGALTGIAIGTGSHFIVVLSGFVIVAVESISMGVGTYLSTKSVKEIEERKLHEERMEIQEHPEQEKQELIGMYVDDGWPKKLASEMAEFAARDDKLMLREMTYRELNIASDDTQNPFQDGILMVLSYIVGGMIPVAPYFFLPISVGLPISLGATLLGLFFLGSATTKFTKRTWWKAGLEMLTLASIAAIVGYTIGYAVERFIG